MTKRVAFTGVDLNGLHDELIAAGVRPLFAGGVAGDATGAVFDLDDAANDAAVAAVAAAHNRAAWQARRAAAAQEATDDADRIRTAYAALAAERDLLVAGSPAAADVRRILLLLVRVDIALVRRELARMGA